MAKKKKRKGVPEEPLMSKAIPPQEIEAKITVRVHGKGTLFLRHEVGSAKDDEENEYEMSADFGSMMPIITSKKTGKIATFTWKNILKAAVEAGIDKE